MGDYLRERLGARGWRVLYPSSLPIAVFVEPSCRVGDGPRPRDRGRDVLSSGEDGSDRDASRLGRICQWVVSSGRAWISTGIVAGGSRTVLRACITNYRTAKEDVDALVDALDEARRTV